MLTQQNETCMPRNAYWVNALTSRALTSRRVFWWAAVETTTPRPDRLAKLDFTAEVQTKTEVWAWYRLALHKLARVHSYWKNSLVA